MFCTGPVQRLCAHHCRTVETTSLFRITAAEKQIALQRQKLETAKNQLQECENLLEEFSFQQTVRGLQPTAAALDLSAALTLS